MIVKDLRLINFRNYFNLNVEFNDNTNIFIGKNAQGKTNLIESIYICSNGKSFRTNKDRELINFNKEQAYIGANIKINNLEKFIEIKMEKDKPKRIRINKSELKNYKELNTGLIAVVFCPDDLKMIKEGPMLRRNFLDINISQIKPVYNYNLIRYNKVLMQRNNLLKTCRVKKDLLNLIDVFDIQLSKLGTSIIIERDKFINELNMLINPTHKNLTCDKEIVELKYLSNIPRLIDRESIEKEYLKLLKFNLNRDLEYGLTEIGPHRDDLSMLINNKDVKIYGSQGQQRTLVLSIKLSVVEYIKKYFGIYPVVLLDDVFSELDEDRRRFLASSFKNMQVFITVTDAVDLSVIQDLSKSVFIVEDGKLIKKHSNNSCKLIRTGGKNVDGTTTY